MNDNNKTVAIIGETEIQSNRIEVQNVSLISLIMYKD